MNEIERPSAAMDDSHKSRLRFQNIAYFACGSIVIVAALVTIVGVALPPPIPCIPGAHDCVSVADWGASIVSRMKDASSVLFELLTALGGFAGLTLARGHMDQRIQGGS